ncbi:YodC family protein [Sinorhizobium meliloti]|uniref:YodC family protein n=1 Tax=Rhizobium meliloti TaxID=382 RepID=UPI000FD457B6|nr:DUF2158 domain-containing protein [Sinorhizobium meliloti]MQV04156.1 DUF2158 domain-containing protein [Sinorhizobium meliloti]RVJ77560.1 DUF2158 domain-containing protein [Sinorhizobium meliloti]
MFKPGDTVRLKSGSPLMTVEKVGTDMGGAQKAWVKWFNGNDVKTDSFVIEALEVDNGGNIL